MPAPMSRMPSTPTISNVETGRLPPVVGRLPGVFAAGVVFAIGVFVAAAPDEAGVVIAIGVFVAAAPDEAGVVFAIGVLVVAAPAEAAIT